MHQSPTRHIDPQLKPLLSAIRALLPARSLKTCSPWVMGLSLSIQAVTFAVMADNAHAQPIPISTEPQNNQQQVPVNSTINVSFDQRIRPGAGHFIISNGQGDTRRISGLDGNRLNIIDNNLIINPWASLVANSNYTVSMEGGALTDDAYKPLPAVTAAAGLHFTTAPPLSSSSDKTAPLPLSVSPALNATGVESSVIITAIFNEGIKAGIGNITLDNGKGDRQSIAIEDTSYISFSELPNKQYQIDIRPKRTLLTNSQYAVLVDPGAIIDLAGNPFAGVQDKTIYTFNTLADKTPPTLAAPNTLEAFTGGFTLNFNEGVQAGAGSIILIDAQGNKRSIAIHDAKQVDVAKPGSYAIPRLVIRPQDGLLADSHYTVQLTEGVLTDQAGNAFAGVQDKSLSFITPAALPQDKTPPHVISTLPALNQAQVLVGGNIEVQFDEAVRLAETGAFILSNGLGDSRSIAINDSSQVYYGSLSSSGKNIQDQSKVIINPSEDLLANSHYNIQMPADAVRDYASNPVQAASLSFTTAADGTPPVALSVSPANQSQQVPLDTSITVQFSEAVKAGMGEFFLWGDIAFNHLSINATDTTQVTFQGNSLTIHPAQALLPNTRYELTLSGSPITDLTGNPYVSLKSSSNYFDLTFNTITTSPSPIHLQGMINTLNRDGLTYINSSVFLGFNATIKPGSGFLTLSNGQGDTRKFDVNDQSQVGFDRNTLNIVPINNLLPNAYYSLQIDPGAITDINSNAYAGVQDTSLLNFMTAAAAPPVLQQFSVSNISYSSPGAHTYLHQSESPIQLDFDSQIKLGRGNISFSNGQGDIRRIAITDQTQVTLAVGYDQIASNYFPVNNRLTIKPTQALLSNSRYAVQIDAGAITDLTGMPFGGIQDSNTISFATGNPYPSPAASNPVQEINRGGTAGVYDNNDIVVFNFNVPVTWAAFPGGFALSSHDFGGNDVVFSPDGRSASVVLNTASTIVRGDTVTFGIRDFADIQWNVTFTL